MEFRDQVFTRTVGESTLSKQKRRPRLRASGSVVIV